MSHILEKKIKKHIYGTPQCIKITYPPGLGVIAQKETSYILNNSWFPAKYTHKLSALKNEIRIEDIHLFAAVELLLRSQCLSDIRLIIVEGKVVGKSAFKKKCQNINWDFFVNKDMTIKIKVNSVASHAFHESGLKEILSEILKNHVLDIVSGENTDETTCLYVDFYKDRLTLSISLTGTALYKRGYRGVLSASAPLREDAAACFIQAAFSYVQEFIPNFLADAVLIPFSGTGTFAFEYLLFYLSFAPGLLGREYALQKMPLFRAEHFNFLLKKAKESCLFIENPPKFFCIDHSKEAHAALLENKLSFQQTGVNIEAICDDFFKIDINQLITENYKNIFMPLNPPYGIRLNKHTNTVALYKNIAKKINVMAMSNKNILGLILCPDEKTWSAFQSALPCKNTSTYHFTQGGLDVRVCQFLIKCA